MKITVLNGSPKGATSVTMQYVRYMQKQFPQHEIDMVHIAQRIKTLERNLKAFQEVIDQIQASDGVLWGFPLYILHVHAHYKRFIELIWERGAQSAFESKYAAALSTSIHFFDNTAHEYIHGICDDLGMRYVGSFSAEMRDLLKEEGQVQLTTFGQKFFDAIEYRSPTARSYPSLSTRQFDYVPGPVSDTVCTNGHRVLILHDAEPGQQNLRGMVARMEAALGGSVDTLNLHELDIKASCQGCLQCGYDYACAFTGKDDYIDFFNAKVRTADILVFAGAMKDRYLSSTWKTFFDRSFFNTHTPSLVGKQLIWMVSGPLSQAPNLRQILQGWSELQHSNAVAYVSDEYGDSAEIDALLTSAAADAVRFADTAYIQPRTFLGVGGMKIFRDDIYGRLRTVFQADHRAYKRMGIYDFPQRDIGVRVLNAVTPILFKMPRFRREFNQRIKEQMVQPYQRVIDG
jgi:multimeric flavodoxin WrbA